MTSKLVTTPTRDLSDQQLIDLQIALNTIYQTPFTYDTLKRITKALTYIFFKEGFKSNALPDLYKKINADPYIIDIVYQNPDKYKEYNLSNILNLGDEQGGVTMGRKHANSIVAEIYRAIERPKHEGMVTGEIGTDMMVVINPFDMTVSRETVKIMNKKDYSKTNTIIDAYPEKITVYDSPIADEPRKFEIIWKSKVSPRPLKTGPDLLEEIKGTLVDSGYVVATRIINDILPAMVNTYIKKGLVEMKSDIETPGFFYIPERKEISAIHQDIEDPPTDDIKDALRVFEELAKWYPGHKDKIASIFKYGLIAPFSYAKKQIGGWMPYMYLYGKARSGKTTLGQMVLYMWGHPGDDNDISGTNFDSVAKVGNRISQSTLPIVVNEPAGAFQRLTITEMLKSAVEKLTARGRHESMKYRNIPSFAPVIFTANTFVPDDDALIRRFFLINFTHSEAKSIEDIEKFEDEWQTNNQQKCKFNLLRGASYAVTTEILNDHELLKMDWQKLADELITRLYKRIEVEPPQWVYKWSKSETMEDMDEEHREDIRILLLDSINQAYGRVKVIDATTGREQEKFDEYNTQINKSVEFKERVWQVMNQRLIGWLMPYSYKQRDHVALTIGFKKEVQASLKVCQPLKGIAELMGWDYRKIKTPRDQKVILVKLKDFLEFLYPTEAKE